MIKHIVKIIWNQRKANAWIFAELLIVVCALWWMADQFYVDTRVYYSPLGYDISNTWRFQLDELVPNAPGYVSPEEISTTSLEDLLKLQTQIRQHPAVENVCFSFYSAPYTFGNSWSGIETIDGDTTVKQNSFQQRTVSPDFFDLFRIKDIHGNDISPQLKGVHNPIVVSEDMAILFFRTTEVSGRQIKYRGDEESLTIVTASLPYRDTEYKKSEAFFYSILTEERLNNISFSATQAELCVRMKQNLSQDEMNRFLQEMGGRLTVNNLYVYGATSLEYYKGEHLRGTEKEQSRKLSLMAFLLINVLFGIIGTFWLRTQYRHGELGLRVALGASKSTVRTYMYMEGILLLLLTVPFSLVFALNIINVDVLDTYRLPYTIGRFLITYGGVYLLMAGMICLGIFFPVRKAEQIAPAEALHYE